jgi:hypothetical protein
MGHPRNDCCVRLESHTINSQMPKFERLCIPALIGVCFAAPAQIKRTSVPLGDAVDKALEKGVVTGKGAKPFHILVKISEPENPQSPYQGTIEEWWVSAEQWRREVTDKDGMRQTIVIAAGQKTEKDEGDYFPLGFATSSRPSSIRFRMCPCGRQAG